MRCYLPSRSLPANSQAASLPQALALPRAKIKAQNLRLQNRASRDSL